MKKTLLILALALLSLSALAGKTSSERQAIVLKPYDNSQSSVAVALNRNVRSCLSSCRFQQQLCNAYTPGARCQRNFEICIDACFN